MGAVNVLCLSPIIFFHVVNSNGPFTVPSNLDILCFFFDSSSITYSCSLVCGTAQCKTMIPYLAGVYFYLPPSMQIFKQVLQIVCALWSSADQIYKNMTLLWNRLSVVNWQCWSSHDAKWSCFHYSKRFYDLFHKICWFHDTKNNVRR